MNKTNFAVAGAAALLISNLAVAKDVTLTFSVDTAAIGTTNAILQVGMYARHGNGTTASGIWDDIELTGPQSFTDDFDDRQLNDATIGNNWTWFDTNWDTEDCSGDSSGSYGPWSDGDGNSDYVADNNNYTRHGDNGANYFRAGLENDGNGGRALNVYHNQYATSACNEIKIFKEFNVPKGELDGSYTFTATVVANQYTEIAQGNEVGVFFKVLEGDPSYAETATDFQTELDNPAPAAPPAPAAAAGDTAPIPALPLGGLLGLVALVGWLGARRKF